MKSALNFDIRFKTQVKIYNGLGELLFEGHNLVLSAGIDWWSQMIASSDGVLSHTPPDTLYISDNPATPDRDEDPYLSNEQTSFNVSLSDALSRWWETYTNGLRVHFGGYFSHTKDINLYRLGLASQTADKKYTALALTLNVESGNDLFVDYILDISSNNSYNYIQDKFWQNLGLACINRGNMNINYFYYYDGASWNSSGNKVSRSYSRIYSDRKDNTSWVTFYEKIPLTNWNDTFTDFEVRNNGDVLLKTGTTSAIEKQNRVQFVNVVTYF